jgi:hypothetical protein
MLRREDVQQNVHRGMFTMLMNKNVRGVGLDSFMKTAAHPNPVKITLATFAHWVSSQPKMRKKKTQVKALPRIP